MHQIFYVTLDPEKALGVEELIPSYHILYSENSQLVVPIANCGIDIKNFPKPANSKAFNTAKLLQNPSLQDYIKRNTHEIPDVLVFKNDKKIQEVCKKLNYNLLNPDPSFAHYLENKVEFAKFVDSTQIFKQPDYQTFEKLEDVSYSNVSAEFGREFVVQFFYGHSGNCTFFIGNEAELQELQEKYPLRKGKVVKKIEGPTYTINACVTRLGVVIGGISEQITGVSALTSSKGGTVGNDFTQRHLTDGLRADLVLKTMQFGEVLMKESYRGIFGLDIILDRDEDTFYLIEANLRQVMSCSYFSYLQRLSKNVPIMLWHTLELLNHNYYEKFDSLIEEDEGWINSKIEEFRLSSDKLSYNIASNQPTNASQIFFRNVKPYSVKVLDQFPSGIYRIRGRLPNESAEIEHEKKYSAIYRLREDGWSTLCFIKRGYNILEAIQEGGLLINAAPEGAIIPEFGEIGRIQILESAFGSPEDVDVSGWIIDVVNAVYENTRMIHS